jgi:hypothetical protein
VKVGKVDCNGVAIHKKKYCAKYLLAAQLHFMEQRTAVHEAVEKPAIFSTCISSSIANASGWKDTGAAKPIARVNCDYSFQSVKANLPIFLHEVSPADSTPTLIRRFYDRSWLYIGSYSEKLPADEVATVV